MKHILRNFLTTVLLLALSSIAVQAQTKIATVDLQKLFDNYWKTKQAQTALDDHKQQLAKDDNGFIADLKKARADYDQLVASANDQAVSADERAKRQKAADDKLKQIKDSEDNIAQFEQRARATLADQSQRMRDSILKEIQAVVIEKAKAGGYSLVLDASGQTANQTSLVVYTSGENNLTSAVLNQLNAGAPIDMTKPSTPAPLTLSTNNP